MTSFWFQVRNQKDVFFGQEGPIRHELRGWEEGW